MMKRALSLMIAMTACLSTAQTWTPQWSKQVGAAASYNVTPIKAAWDTALVQFSTTGADVKSYTDGAEGDPKNLVFGSSGEIYTLSGYNGGNAYLRRFNP